LKILVSKNVVNQAGDYWRCMKGRILSFRWNLVFAIN